MKYLIKIIVFLAFVFSTLTQVSAKDAPIKTKSLKYEQVEETLLMGLNSDNLGLRISCSYMLGEIKSQNAIPELTSIIKTTKNDKARLTAILALLKMVSSEGIEVINQDEQSSEISQICAKLVNCHECLSKIIETHKKEEVSVINE